MCQQSATVALTIVNTPQRISAARSHTTVFNIARLGTRSVFQSPCLGSAASRFEDKYEGLEIDKYRRAIHWTFWRVSDLLKQPRRHPLGHKVSPEFHQTFTGNRPEVFLSTYLRLFASFCSGSI